MAWRRGSADVWHNDGHGGRKLSRDPTPAPWFRSHCRVTAVVWLCVVALVASSPVAAPAAGSTLSWTQQATLPVPDGLNALAVWSVAASRNDVLVGTNSSQGVFAYERQPDDTWEIIQQLRPGIARSGVRAVAVDGRTAVVGEGWPHSFTERGVAVIFEKKKTGTWEAVAKFSSSDFGSQFGAAVAVDDDLVVVGNPNAGSRTTGKGSASIYRRSLTGEWVFEATLTPADRQDGDGFGSAVAVHDGTIVVGQPGHDDLDLDDLGAVEVFKRDQNGNWTRQDRITPAADVAGHGLRFGNDVSVRGSRIAVGINRLSSVRSAFLYEEPGAGSWNLSARIQSPTLAGRPSFGAAVDLGDDRLVVGAPDANTRGFRSGTAFVFDRATDGSWTEWAELIPSGANDQSSIGFDVELDDETALVAAPRFGRSGEVWAFPFVSDDYVFPVERFITLRAIEVNQGVQDWRNSVPLVARRRTIVRVFLEVETGEAPIEAAGLLHGEVAGMPLEGSPLEPIGDNTIEVDADAAARRGDLGASLNFLLPESWTSGPDPMDLAFEVRGTDRTLACVEPDPLQRAAGECWVRRTFRHVPNPEIEVVRVEYPEDGSPVFPDTADLLEQLARLESTLPVARVRASVGSLFADTFEEKPGLDDVNKALKTKRTLQLASNPEIHTDALRLYGFLLGSGAGLASGRFVSSAYDSGTADPLTEGYAHNRGPHEVAHSFGKAHATDPELPLDEDGLQQGACGSDAPADAPPHPHFAEIDGDRRAVIGPLDEGVDNEIWGLETRYVPNDDNGFAVVDPRETFELLSYCGGENQARWPSAFTLGALRQGISEVAEEAAVATTDGAGDVAVVVGTIDSETGDVEIDPLTVGTGRVPANEHGDLRVALVSEDGTELAAADVLAEVEGHQADGLGPNEPRPPHPAMFGAALPLPSQPIDAIVVSREGDVLTRRHASANPPEVAIDLPLGGEVVTDELTVSWTASDLDGDELSATLHYSADNGTTWRPLVVGTGETTATLGRHGLSASETARVKVVVSDGLHVAVDISEAFTVPNAPPEVVVTTPSADGASVTGGAGLVLTASALDPDDGLLDGDDISWSSSLDGALGSGSPLVVPSSRLSTGCHAMTATVTDAGGLSAFATVTVGVDDTGCGGNEPPAIDGLEPAQQTVAYSDEIVEVSVIATDSDGDALTLTATGLPDGITATLDECTTAPNGSSRCAWALSGAVGSEAESYTGTLTVSDGQAADTAMVSFTVVPEDATVMPSDANPAAVQVEEDGGRSGKFSLSAVVVETEPDEASGSPSPGELTRARVSMSLVPVGPGGTVGPIVCEDTTRTGDGYDQELIASCTFDGIEVNTYTLEIIVDGGFYSGSGEDAFTVYDPSLGGATGGGTFFWPGTADPERAYPGDRTNFGFTMEYTKQGTRLRGSLLVIRHLPDDSKFRVKSNALEALALGEDASGPMRWATFTGKATYLEPGWEEPEGNHGFTVYVEDRGEPGAGADRFWLEVTGKDGAIITAFSMETPAADHARTVAGGNVVVPLM